VPASVYKLAVTVVESRSVYNLHVIANLMQNVCLLISNIKSLFFNLAILD